MRHPYALIFLLATSFPGGAAEIHLSPAGGDCGRFAYNGKVPLAGAKVVLDVSLSPKGAACSAGLTFGGIVASDGRPLTTGISPVPRQLRVGAKQAPLPPLPEDPNHFELEYVFLPAAVEVYWGGKLQQRVPVTYPARESGIVFSACHCPAKVSRFDVIRGEGAASLADVTLTLNSSTMTQLRGQWWEYFGTHYEKTGAGAGRWWGTVRGFNGPRTGLRADEAARGKGEPARTGPFTGKPVRISLRDCLADAEGKYAGSAEELVPEIVNNKLTAIFNMARVVKPSADQPFDKDLVYWFMRLIYERFPAAKDYVIWEIGNELMSAHFDPLGLAEKGVQKGESPDGKFNGYDIEWKRDYYVTQYLAPAIEAIERASRDVYGDPRRIRILLGSVNPYNQPNIRFLKGVMESRFDGKQAPSLKGGPVWKHFEAVNVHYMFGNEKNVPAMQEFLDAYVRTGRVKALWDTEEHGRAGKGPVTILETGLHFLDWVARNRLTPAQTRAIWWGDSDRAGGSGRELETLMGGFLRGRPLCFARVRKSDGSFYLLADGRDASVSRIAIAVMPESGGEMPLGALRLSVPGGAGKPWRAVAYQFSALTRPRISPVRVEARGEALTIPVSSAIAEPYLVLVTANPDVSLTEGCAT